MASNVLINVPVQSVNGETGTVVLDASSVGAAEETHTHTESDITDLGSYLTDADSDDILYGRENGEWVEVDTSSGIEDAASNGYPYIRKDEGWVRPAIVSTGISTTGIGIKIEDADASDSYTIPSATTTTAGLMSATDKTSLDALDDIQTEVDLNTAKVTFTDADSDGTTYGRQDGAWVNVESSTTDSYYTDVYLESGDDHGLQLRTALAEMYADDGIYTLRVHGLLEINATTTFETTTINSIDYDVMLSVSNDVYSYTNVVLDFSNCQCTLDYTTITATNTFVAIYIESAYTTLKGFSVEEYTSGVSTVAIYLVYIDGGNCIVTDFFVKVTSLQLTSELFTPIYNYSGSLYLKLLNCNFQVRSYSTNLAYFFYLDGGYITINNCIFIYDSYSYLSGDESLVTSCNFDGYMTLDGSDNFISSCRLSKLTITDNGTDNDYTYNVV